MASPPEDPNFQNTGAKPKQGQVTDPGVQSQDPLEQQGQATLPTGQVNVGPEVTQPGQTKTSAISAGAPKTPTIGGRARNTSGKIQFDKEEYLKNFSHLTLQPTDSMEARLLKQNTADAIVAAELARRDADHYRNVVRRQNDDRQADQKAYNDQRDQIARMAAQLNNLQGAAAMPQNYTQPPPAAPNPALQQYYGYLDPYAQQPASASFSVTLAQPPVVQTLNNSGNLSINSQNISQNITMATPQEEHINTRKQLLDQEHLMLTIQAQNLELMHQNLANAAIPPTQAQIKSYNAMTDRVSKGLAELDKKRAALVHTKSVAESFKTSLRMPPLALTEAGYTDALRKKLEGKNVVSAIRKFNPDKDPEADFTDTWNHILLYTKGFTLTTSSYLDILLYLLEGSAYRSLMDMTESKLGLAEILKTLCSLYSKRKTMLDLIQNINDFTRHANENIEKTMSRATIVIEKVRGNFPAAEWDSNRDRMLQSILSQVISKATKAHLDAEERKCLMVGAKMSYQSKLDTVDSFEHANNELPRHSVATVINACTGTPIDSKFNFEGNKSYYQINAVVPREKRSAMKARSKSRDRHSSGTRDRAARSRGDGVNTPLPADDWDMEVGHDVQTRQRAQAALYEKANQVAREKSIERPKSRSGSPFKRSVRSLSRTRGRSPGQRPDARRVDSRSRRPSESSQPSDSYSQGLPGNQQMLQQQQQQQVVQQPQPVVPQPVPQVPQVAPIIMPQYIPHPSQVHPGSNYAPQHYYSHGPYHRQRSSSAGKRSHDHASRSRGRDDRETYFRQRSSERRRAHSKSPSRFYANSYYPPHPYQPAPYPPVDPRYYQNQPTQGSSGNSNGGKRRGRGEKAKDPNPKITDEGNSRKISFSSGKVDIYLCNNGCENSYHTTQTCPRFNKSLN